MNDERLDKLFQTARGVKREVSRAEYGFETRLLARLRSETRQSVPWFAVAWRLMPVFAAIVLALGVWNLTDVVYGPADLHTTIAGESQQSLVTGYLTGE